MAIGDWSDWSERRRLAVTAGVVGAIVVIMGGLVAWVYLKHRALDQEIGKEGAELSRMVEEAERLDEVREDRNKKYEANKERLNELPNKRMIQSLTREINRLADESNLSVVDFEELVKATPLRPAAGTGQYRKAKMRWRLEGGYDALGRFVNGLEERGLKRLVEVDTFKISGQDDGTKPGAKNHDIVLEIGAYYSPSTTGVTAVP